MKLRRLTPHFDFEEELDVPDALKEAMAEISNERILAAAFIKEPFEIFLLATIEMEPETGAPQTVHATYKLAETDAILRAGLQDMAIGLFKSLDVKTPEPIWDS